MSAFAHRDFRLFQAARFVGTIAMQMQSVAIGWHVYAITGRALDLGYVGLAQFVPAIGLSLVTGHTADRFDRRRVILFCYAALAACWLLLYFLARIPSPRLAPLYATLVLIGSARAFLAPASQALLPHLVPKEDFSSAVAVSSSIWQVATIVGPSLGGVAYALAGAAAPVFAICAVFLGASALLVGAMKIRTGRMEKRATSLTTLFAGIGYVRENKIVLGAISLDLFAVLLGGAVALLPIFARDILHTGPWGLGVLRSAPAVGAAVTAATLARKPLTRNAGKIMLACVALFGVGTIAFGLSRSFAISIVALLAIGASDMVSVYVRQQLVLLATPEAMRGRVSAVNMVFVGASNELGEFESGITAAWWGAIPAVVIGGVGTLLVVAVWSVLFPSLRDVDRLDLKS